MHKSESGHDMMQTFNPSQEIPDMLIANFNGDEEVISQDLVSEENLEEEQ